VIAAQHVAMAYERVGIAIAEHVPHTMREASMNYRTFAFVLTVAAGCATDTTPDALDIQLGEQTLSASRGDDRFALAWSDTAATIEVDGVTTTIVHVEQGAWTPSAVTETGALARAARLLGDAEAELATEGFALPWRMMDVQANAACETVSTWVRGGAESCADCRAVAWREAGAPTNPDAYSGGSCSQGTFYTTCSHTWCTANYDESVQPILD
jgi:hypothetical protein